MALCPRSGTADGATVAGDRTPWYAWSWWVLGSAIPDTFAIETVQRSFGPWGFANGPRLHLERDALATIVSFAPPALGGAALLGWGAAFPRLRAADRSAMLPAVPLGAAGIAYYGVYVLLAVPPYRWYYVPTMVSLAPSLCVLLGGALRAGTRRRRAVALPGLALAALLVGGNEVVEVRGGVPWRVPVIFGNRATAADYARAGRALGERVGDQTVLAPPEIGTLAYFCECAIVDAFADRGRAVPLIETRIADARPALRALLEPNYLRLDRERPPRLARYRLVREPEAATGPDQWGTRSPATGPGWLCLEELPAR